MPAKTLLHLILNAAELPQAQADAPPEWLLLLPAGSKVRGRDGRELASPGAQALIAAHASLPDLPVDINHASLWRAMMGDPSPAVGWVRELQEREGAMWGRVEWNPAGERAIAGKEYRYHSPVYLPDPRVRGRIASLHSVALVNTPNLDVPPLSNSTEATMDARILAALGLQPDATTEQVIEAIANLRSPQHSPQQGGIATVPKADYDVMANRAKTAEQTLTDRDAAALKAEAEAAVEAAVTKRQISPASRAYYLANCATREGLDAFKEFAAAAPAIIPEGSVAPAGAAPQSAGSQQSAEQQWSDDQLGLEPEGKGKKE